MRTATSRIKKQVRELPDSEKLVLSDAFDWYERQLPGLGFEFLRDVEAASFAEPSFAAFHTA